MSEKPWYVAIKDVNPQQDSGGIADWYKQSNTPLNPMTFKDLPKPYHFIYIYLIQTVIYKIDNATIHTKCIAELKKYIMLYKDRVNKNIYTKLLVYGLIYKDVNVILYKESKNIKIVPPGFHFTTFINMLKEFNEPYKSFDKAKVSMNSFYDFFDIENLFTSLLNDAPPSTQKKPSFWDTYYTYMQKFIVHLK
jgi:hypothetical protein